MRTLHLGYEINQIIDRPTFLISLAQHQGYAKPAPVLLRLLRFVHSPHPAAIGWIVASGISCSFVSF